MTEPQCKFKAGDRVRYRDKNSPSESYPYTYTVSIRRPKTRAFLNCVYFEEVNGLHQVEQLELVQAGCSTTLLDKAKDLIYGDRHDAYGEFSEQAGQIAKQFEIILAPELNGNKIPIEKAALLIDGLKTVRLAQNPTHTDSWVDKAGYAGLSGKLPSIWTASHAREGVRPSMVPDNAFRVRSVNDCFAPMGSVQWVWPNKFNSRHLDGLREGCIQKNWVSAAMDNGFKFWKHV